MLVSLVTAITFGNFLRYGAKSICDVECIPQRTFPTDALGVFVCYRHDSARDAC